MQIGRATKKVSVLDETARILAQLLGLLGYIHSKGFDHRDMDSDLIFIREDGSLSLLGIGLKAALGVPLFEEVVSASVSPLNPQQSVERLSSFDVMSPEYKSGIEEDHRVDLYCVGVLGYWLLTGQKADQARYRAPSEYIGAKAAYWDPFFEKMLRRDRDQRIQSCRSALLALRNTDALPRRQESPNSSVRSPVFRCPRGFVRGGSWQRAPTVSP